jgi:hypothetical protein
VRPVSSLVGSVSQRWEGYGVIAIRPGFTQVKLALTIRREREYQFQQDIKVSDLNGSIRLKRY